MTKIISICNINEFFANSILLNFEKLLFYLIVLLKQNKVYIY